MTIRLTCMTVALSLVALPAFAATDTTALLAKQFKKRNGDCWVYSDKDKNDYCLKTGPSREVTIGNQRYLYALAVGDAYDYLQQQPITAHAYNGIVSMFVYKQVGESWQLTNSRHGIHVGAYGESPKGKDWQLYQFGPETYGFVATHTDMHHGYAGGHYVVLTPWKNSIANTWLGSWYNTEGASEDGKKYADISTTFSIDQNKKTTAGMYPLTVRATDKSNGKPHPKRSYAVTFDAKKGEYVAPKNYPLRDIDY